MKKSDGRRDFYSIRTSIPAIARSRSQYPTKRRLIFILLSLVLGSFLVAIDTIIISVAIPRISTDFRALNDVGWYGSAYFTTLTAFQPITGHIFKEFDPKLAYTAAVVVFEGENEYLLTCFLLPSSRR